MLGKENTIESLISEGFIGIGLGNALIQNREDRSEIGALLSAALSATLKASQAAQKMDIPYLIEEDGGLYKIEKGGGKTFIQKLPKPRLQLPLEFRLK